METLLRCHCEVPAYRKNMNTHILACYVRVERFHPNGSSWRDSSTDELSNMNRASQ